MSEKMKLPTRSQFVAVVSGNALEFYDFLSFSFFAVNVARVMFPAGAPGTALLMTLMTGAVGYFARPLGAIVFGLLGDRIGRRPTMLATFALMGFSALGLALTPNYAQIGLAAPVLVVAFRLLQGLAAGGDVGPTTAYLAEAAPPERRAFYISLQLVAMRIGAMVSGMVGLGLAASLTQAELDSYGWRIAFGLGAAIVPLAFALRRRLEETLHWEETGPQVVTSISPGRYVATLLGILGFLTGSGTADFMFIYGTTFLKATPSQGYLLTMGAAGLQALAQVLGGTLSDRFGRRPVKLVTSLLVFVIAVPLFHWVAAGASFERLVPAVLLLSFVTSTSAGAFYPTFVESTPKRMRSGLVGISYGLIVAVSFGVTPIVITQYVHATGDLAGPGYAWLIGSILMLASALLVPETSFRHRKN